MRSSEKVETHLARIKDETERATRFDERAVQWQRWIDKAIEDEVEGGGAVDVEPADLIPAALAAQHDLVDQEFAAVDAKMRQENGALRRAIIEREIAHASERRARTLEASRLRRRIGALEEQLASERQAREEFAKALASMAKEIAKDRALHRMRDGRRLLPHAQRADLERARRKTDRAIEDRLSEGEFHA